MQILLKGVVADGAYVTARAWEHAILVACPFHPERDCGVERLGSYPRVWPVGCRIARFWCPLAKRSISLLPESLAAGVSGTLDAIEAAVDAVQRHGVSGAVEKVFPSDSEEAIGLTSATRSLRRRVRWVRSALLSVVTLLSDRLASVSPTLESLRAALGVDLVLVALRSIAQVHLRELGRPFGFRTRSSA